MSYDRPEVFHYYQHSDGLSLHYNIAVDYHAAILGVRGQNSRGSSPCVYAPAWKLHGGAHAVWNACVCVCACSLCNLESLELRENLIKYLPASLSCLVRLKTLDLGSNLIDELVCSRLFSAVSLVSLSITRHHAAADTTHTVALLLRAKLRSVL